MGSKSFLSLLLFSGLLFFLVHWRWDQDQSFDLRGVKRILELRSLRESDAFQSRLVRAQNSQAFFPGLKAAHLSVIWLETLSGLNHGDSAKGDFSWLFSKLHTVAVNSHRDEVPRLLALAPFFYVLGDDPIGATVLMNEIIERRPDLWRTWYWSGFHALENLVDSQMAAHFYEKASLIEGAPYFLPALILRLKVGQDPLSFGEKRQIFIKELPEPLQKKLSVLRPEYFQDKVTRN